MLEDGLLLWVISLRNAPQPEPGLLGLFPCLLPLLQRSTGKLLPEDCCLLMVGALSNHALCLHAGRTPHCILGLCARL